MKKNYLLIVVLLCLTNMISAQNYYYYKSQKQTLILDKTGFDIYVNNIFQTTNINYNNIEQVNLVVSNLEEKSGNIEFINTPSDLDYYAKINELKSNSDVISVQPRFITPDGNTLSLSNYLFVKLKNTSDLSILQTLAATKNFTIVGPNQFMPMWYKLKCSKNTLGNPLEIANYLFETGHFAASNPDFLSKSFEEEELQALIPNNNSTNTNTTACANDPNFGDLWGLKNTINPGIDIDVCNAWTITEGANVKVAVLDTGIDLTNLDLGSNILPLSYDTVTGTSPSQTYRSHGTQVAGIIGAIKNNNYQVVGVAPQSKLFSISATLSFSLASVEQNANGINWAWQNGADIINNSWFLIYYSDFLDDSISNALALGRNGLGTIVVFASGNSRKPQNPTSFSITYPANSNEKIIVVGSIDNNGIRAFDSCYGDKLDVVAPGVNILTTSYDNLLKTDSGTSLASPYVAGICALILCPSILV